jgi:hypothetical protein
MFKDVLAWSLLLTSAMAGISVNSSLLAKLKHRSGSTSIIAATSVVKSQNSICAETASLDSVVL